MTRIGASKLGPRNRNGDERCPRHQAATEGARLAARQGVASAALGRRARPVRMPPLGYHHSPRAVCGARSGTARLLRGMRPSSAGTVVFRSAISFLQCKFAQPPGSLAVHRRRWPASAGSYRAQGRAQSYHATGFTGVLPNALLTIVQRVIMVKENTAMITGANTRRLPTPRNFVARIVRVAVGSWVG
jgi:hypothetical protein